MIKPINFQLTIDEAKAMVNTLGRHRDALVRAHNEVLFRRASFLPVSDALIEKLNELTKTENMIIQLRKRISDVEKKARKSC